MANPDDLHELALRAVVTPSLEASDCLDVLTDALLERGLIKPRQPRMGKLVPGSSRHRKALSKAVSWRRMAAWWWARDATNTPLERFFAPGFQPAPWQTYSNLIADAEAVTPETIRRAFEDLRRDIAARMSPEGQRLYSFPPDLRIPVAMPHPFLGFRLNTDAPTPSNLGGQPVASGTDEPKK